MLLPDNQQHVCEANSHKKSAVLDHIAETYNFLSCKYRDGLHWVLAGDTNDLKLDPILALSPNLRQVVTELTRMDPPSILDPIITTLTKFYQTPKCVPPIAPDISGKPSDHLMVIMNPLI